MGRDFEILSKHQTIALLVKLVDAPGLDPGALTGVGVRVSQRAPNLYLAIVKAACRSPKPCGRGSIPRRDASLFQCVMSKADGQVRNLEVGISKFPTLTKNSPISLMAELVLWEHGAGVRFTHWRPKELW